ncbi:MAG: hypothetical protein CND89_04935 [Marine Group II euryarchaeote MED-G38]|nr:hypothetical protein [Euryarchaeota archaeon]OUV27497.1 MAG: hypothetical protein CBC57_00600 [Euryarchaeota archaeon TMED97]PDH22188.1 MAG: hypothetical protein CND89_04935 [Marine Group II euryarchaeote MED-G38]|tara:strand:- start:18699 stop:18962 length:264 start_codon:yes stop_codon:yes gene_type:complete
MEDPPSLWWKDPLSLLGLLQGILIWLIMVYFLNLEVAWISFSCGGLIGFFLWLTALGYQKPLIAKMTLLGIFFNAILSLFSAYLAFS